MALFLDHGSGSGNMDIFGTPMNSVGVQQGLQGMGQDLNDRDAFGLYGNADYGNLGMQNFGVCRCCYGDASLLRVTNLRCLA